MSSAVAYTYAVIREIIGVAAPESGDAVLLDDVSSGSWACLTRQVGPHRREVDESAAVGTMLLRGLVGGGPDGTFLERLEAEADAIADERNQGGRERHFLVLKIRGVTTNWTAAAEREVDGIVIRLNGAPTLGIQERAKIELAALVVGLTQRTGRPVRLSPHAEGVIFHRPDGKKMFAKALEGGPVGVFVTTPWDPADQPKLQADVLALRGLEGLDRVYQLFAASIEQVDDRLRAFQAGWSALEIFVNKVFRSYETAFLASLTSEQDPQAKVWYLDRIREVMSDKYRLRDRFSLIAATLAPDDADGDMKHFMEAKKARDAIAHGRKVAEESLPVDQVHRILGKYLHLHGANAK